MLHEPENGLIGRIIEDFRNPNTQLWFPDLTRELVEAEWGNLAQNRIEQGCYGTVRFLRNCSEAPRVTAIEVLLDHRSDVCVVPIEVLPQELQNQYRKKGVAFYSESDLTTTNGEEIASCIDDAFRFVGFVPTLFKTIPSLVRSMHVIKPASDEYDVSFSEPDIPFSIFVSVPRKNSEINAIRVAEAIVHEAMHLLLTLLGKALPLVNYDQERNYSPWKKQMRTTEGLLHGAYVFRVLNDFFSNLLATDYLSSTIVCHVEDRRNEIAGQISDVRRLVGSQELSEAGRLLAKRLIDESRDMTNSSEVVFDKMAGH